jgi:DNA-binding ferritin-like protein (Dps family)
MAILLSIHHIGKFLWTKSSFLHKFIKHILCEIMEVFGFSKKEIQFPKQLIGSDILID